MKIASAVEIPGKPIAEETETSVQQALEFPGETVNPKPRNKGGRPRKHRVAESKPETSSELPPEKQKRFVALVMTVINKIFGILSYFGASPLSDEERMAFEELVQIEVSFWEETALTRFRSILRVALFALFFIMVASRVYTILSKKRKPVL